MTVGEPWPLSARVNSLDHLEIAGCDVTELVREYGTPLYVFDHATLVDRATRARDAFAARWPDSTILYATKAYFSPFLARLYRDLGLGLDVTSEGEIEIARRNGFPPHRIYLHGNNKTPAEIRAALAAGMRHVIVDNYDEIDLLAAQAEEQDAQIETLVRVSPEVDPHTHKYLTTGVIDSKFGLPISTGAAFGAFERLNPHTRLAPVGIHMHIGSQIFELDAIARALQEVLRLAAEVRDKLGLPLRELDLGGGWGVAYLEGQQSVPIERVAETLTAVLDETLPAFGLAPDFKLLVEPGRALVAQAAVALYTVGTIKRQVGARTYVAVDGGMGDNVRSSLYGARYAARAATQFTAPPVMQASIAGRYCEQGDVLVWDAPLPEVRAGDFIALPCAGAYQIPMGSNYNLIPRPAAVLVQDGRARLLRRRETLDDMLACEVG